MDRLLPLQGRTFWERQSLSGKAVISAFVLIPLIGFVGGTLSRVIPSGLSVELGIIVGVLYGLAWVVLVEIGIRRSDPGSFPVKNIMSRRMLRHAWFRAPFMFGVGLMFGYGALTWGLSSAANTWFGLPTTRVVTVVDWVSGMYGSCTHVKIGHPIFVDSPLSCV